MLVYYFVPFIVSNRYLLFWVSNGHNSVNVQNRTHVYMNFFDHKDIGNHLLQLCPKVVKHPVYIPFYCLFSYILLDASQWIMHASRCFDSSLTVNIFDIPSDFSRKIFLIIFRAYLAEICRCFVWRLWVNYLDILSEVSRWMLSIFTASQDSTDKKDTAVDIPC